MRTSSPKITAGRSGRERHARPVSSGSTSRRDCSSADRMRVRFRPPTAPSAGTPATASMRAVKNSAMVGKQQRLIGAVPVPDAVVEAEHRAGEHPGIALRDRALAHRVSEEARPGQLERARLLATRDASLFFAMRGALAAQESLLGNEDAVAQDLALGQLEAVGAHRAQRIPRIGMAGGDGVEALVQLAQRLVEDHVQAVLLGVEVVIERGGPDADVVRDVRPLRVLISAAAEPFDRRVQNLGAPDALVTT